MRIEEVCTHEVVDISPEASIRDAAHLMRRRHVGCLVVVEQPNDAGRISGIPVDDRQPRAHGPRTY